MPNFYTIKRLDPDAPNDKGYQRLLNKGRAKLVATKTPSGPTAMDPVTSFFTRQISWPSSALRATSCPDVRAMYTHTPSPTGPTLLGPSRATSQDSASGHLTVRCLPWPAIASAGCGDKVTLTNAMSISDLITSVQDTPCPSSLWHNLLVWIAVGLSGEAVNTSSMAETNVVSD